MSFIEKHAEKVTSIFFNHHRYLPPGKNLKKELGKAVLIRYSPIKFLGKASVDSVELKSKTVDFKKNSKTTLKGLYSAQECCNDQPFRLHFLEKVLLEGRLQHQHKCSYLQCISQPCQRQILGLLSSKKEKSGSRAIKAKKLIFS
ncbi:MAG: hypothetical protein FJZ63_05340 [Chlamydiae bacterium]|nr:hypothetical protein [Chlamydiota bacterium]